jgi:hypothetical protein
MEHEISKIKEFMTAGKALFTLKNEETGNRFTFKVSKPKDENKNMFFVSVLNGPDNYSNYMYMGCIFDKTFKLTRNSKVTQAAPSYRAFNRLWDMITGNHDLPEQVKVLHNGKCARCGRRLTVPESIESGFGPHCLEKALG